jgi:LysM repeat protein
VWEQGVAEDTTDDLLNMRRDDPRIKRNQDITALAKEIYAQMVAERGQPMDRRQQQTWMAIAQTKAAAQLSNTAAQNESQGVAKGPQIDEMFADQGSGSTDRDNADYMKKRRAAKKAGYTGRETKAGTWRVFKDGNAVAAAGPFKSADEAAAWIKKHKQGITEMDKSEPSAGRDTGPREGPEKIAKPITKEKMVKHALDALSKSMAKQDDKKKDVKESDTLMVKLKRAMIQEGRVKELADDLKTMPDSDFMKKYGKAKAAIRADMKRVDEAGISRLGKKDFDFRDGLVGDDETGSEVYNEPELGPFRMGKPVEPNDAATKEFMAALTPSQQDNRFTAPAGWRYVEKDEDPARYGSGPAAATSALPNLIYDPQSRTSKSADTPALDLSPKSKYKFDRTTQSQVPADGSGANRNIDNATRDRARAYAAQQNAPAAAAKQKVDWKTIYALNKATIGSNPNVIRPRMQLNMPNGTIYLVQPGDNLSKIAAKQNQINELSTEKLAQYKTAAARDARAADQEGDVKRGDKRFSGIVKATKKQFDNDAKQVDESRAARRALMAQIVNHR